MAVPDPLAPLPNSGTLADTVEQSPDLRPVTATAAPLEPQQSWKDWATSGFSFENLHAGRVTARADRTDFDEIRIRDGYAPIVKALGLEDSENPARFYDNNPTAGAKNPILIRSGILASQGKDFMGSMADRATQEGLIAGLIKQRRAKDPKFLAGVPDTVDGIHKYFLAQEAKNRRDAQATLDKTPGLGTTLAGFAGGAIETLHDPVNIITAPIGGGGKTILQTAAREILVNGVLEAAQLPIAAANHAELGEQMTAGEAIGDVAGAAIGGGILGTATHVGGKAAAAVDAKLGVSAAVGNAADKAADQLYAALPVRLQKKWGEAIKANWARRLAKGDKLEDVFGDLSNRELATLARSMHGEDKLTPDERAASNVVEHAEEVGDASPYQPGPAGDVAHEGGLAATIKDLEDRLQPEEVPAASPVAADAVAAATAPARPPAASSTVARPQAGSGEPVGEAAIQSFKAKVGGAENATGNPHAKNPRSSASGNAQFTDGTFRDYYRKVYGQDPGKHPAENLKNDPAVQARLLDALTRDNAGTLRSIGEAVNDGNLYLMHFLGAGDGPRVFKAAPDTPIERILSADVIDANPFLKGKSASEVIAWAHGKMGGSAASVAARPGFGSTLDAAGEDSRIAQLRAEALQLDDAVIGSPRSSGADVPPMYARGFNVDDITVDAKRFQFKGGGDEAGVTDRLKGVTEWNPLYAGRVVAWEDADGKIFLADGHQRHGLAKRIQAETGEPIKMDAIVLRHADGVTAEDARVYAALKNIAEGTGTAIDAAKVIRDAGPHVLEHLPPKSALVRDGAALARLSDAAFGAVYNEVIPPDFAAVIGHLLPDRPDAHEAMVDLLVKLDPANRGQAESIVRQGMAAGLHKETQVELFGERELVTSLMLERAKVLEKGLAKLRKLGLVHKTAANEADTLEASGSKIARERSAQEAKANAEAVEIVSRLAFSRGPVADALNAAARDLAGGSRLGSAVDRFVAGVRELDLAALSREAPGDDANRLAVDGAGRGGDAGETGEAISPESGDQGEPGLFGSVEQPTAAELEAATERFSDPDGQATKQQAESLEHDLRADIDAAEELRKQKKRPTDEQILAGLKASADELHTGWLNTYVKLLRELEEKTGLTVDESNLTRLADEIDAIDQSNNGRGFMTSSLDKWIASHMAPAAAQVTDVSPDAFKTVWKSKPFKDAVAGMTKRGLEDMPHRESPVAEAMVRGWIDGQSGDLAKLGLEAERVLKNTSAYQPHGFNPRQGYIEAYYAAATGKPREIRVLGIGQVLGVREALGELDSEGVLHGVAAPSLTPETRRDAIKAASAALDGGKAGEFRTVEPFPQDEPGYHRFRYVAKDGTPIGGNYTIDGDVLEGFNIGDVHNPIELGAGELMRLFGQIHAEHPDVRYVHAYRTTGARTKEGAGEQEMWLELTDKGARLSADPASIAADKTAPFAGEFERLGIPDSVRVSIRDKSPDNYDVAQFLKDWEAGNEDRRLRDASDALLRGGLEAQPHLGNQELELVMYRQRERGAIAAQYGPGERRKLLEDLHASAEKNHAELVTVGKQLEGELGVKMVDPGVKSLERAIEKSADYANVGDIKDLARVGFVVTKRGQGDKILEQLGRRYAVHDKGWKDLAGYKDRKLIVRLGNGGVAEIQLIPDAIAGYKFSKEGKALYDRARDPKTPAADVLEAVAQMRAAYERLLNGTDFEAVGNDLAKAVGESSDPSVNADRTVSADASRHLPESNTSPELGSSTTTGLSSSSKNLIDGAPNADGLDMGPMADPGKAARDAQELALRAGSPLRPGAIDGEGTMGLGLFDAADQPTFRLDEEGGEVTAKELLDELDADDAAIKAMKECL